MADVNPAPCQPTDRKKAPQVREPVLLARELLEQVDVWCPPDLVPPFLKDVLRLSRKTVSDLSSPRSNQARPSLVWLRIDNHQGGSSLRGGLCGKTLMEQILHLPGDIRNQIKRGARRLILDWSHEGRLVEGESFSSIRHQLEQNGIPAERVAILTQNFAPELMRFRLEASPVGYPLVLQAHHHFAVMWSAFQPGFGQKRTLPVGFALDSGAFRSRHYVCLNWHLRPSRALLVARLRQRAERGYLSFSGQRSRHGRTQALDEGISRLSTPESLAHNRSLVAELIASDHPFDIDPDLHPGGNEFFSYPVTWLRDASCFVVTETEMSGGGLNRFTEKTVKAIVAGLPFILFGNPGTVAELRRVGFDVHDCFIDHAYDAITDPAERFEKAWVEVKKWLDRPSSFTEHELAGLRKAAVHNGSVLNGAMAERWITHPIRTLLGWARG